MAEVHAHRLPLEGPGAAPRHGEGQGLSGPPAGVVREGLLQGPRRARRRLAEGDHEGVPEAGAPEPPRRQPRRHGGRGALQGDLRRLRRGRRRRQAQGVRRGPQARARGRRRSAAGPAAPGRVVHLQRRRRARRHPRRPVRPRQPRWCRRGAAAASARAGATTSRPSCSCRSTDAVHGVTTASTSPATPPARRATAPAPSPAPRRTSAPRAAAAASLDDNQGFFSFSTPCPPCHGTGVVVDDPCPTCRRHRRRAPAARGQGAHPRRVADGQRIRLQGPGRAGSQRRPARRPVRGVHVAAAPAVRPRRAATSRSRVPITYPEAALGADITGAHARRRHGHAPDPSRAPGPGRTFR